MKVIKLSGGKDYEALLALIFALTNGIAHAHMITYLFRRARAHFKLRQIFFSRNLTNDILNASFECHRK